MTGWLQTPFGRRLRRLLPGASRPPVVPVVRLSGTIGIGTPLRPALTLTGVGEALERAFSVKEAREVALLINSPGGAAAQAHLIYRRIRALAEEKGLSVTAFVEDVAASGGYMIACAADEIVADEASIVGSIGVISASFGFDKAIEKLGIERRVHTTGDKKSMLDPFLPERPDDVKRLRLIQRDIYGAFVALVQERRSGRLATSDRSLFSGAFWTGNKARDLGLVDAIGDLHGTLKARYGEDVEIRLVGERSGLFRRLFTPRPATASLAAGLAEEVLTVAETRSLWSRYGL